MKLFFQFFWMGMSKMLYILLCIICIFSCLSIPILIAITVGRILAKLIGMALSVFLGVAIAVIFYCIIYIIYHAIRAVKYYKMPGSDSLKNAWIETGIDWDSF